MWQLVLTWYENDMKLQTNDKKKLNVNEEAVKVILKMIHGLPDSFLPSGFMMNLLLL